MADKIYTANPLVNELVTALLGNQESQMPISMADSVNKHIKKLNDTAKKSTPIKDGYGNSLSSIGSKDKVESFTKYGFDNDTLNFTLWTSLYNDSWVFKKAIDKPAEDMVKCGINILGDGQFEKVYKDFRKASSSLIRLIKWGRLYGGSVALVQFDSFDDEDYMKPMKQNVEKIKKSKVIRLYVTDRWYGVAQRGTSMVTDMDDIDFGKPTEYQITYADGKNINVKHDYVLRFENRDAPNLVKNGMLQGWGYAEGSHILNELSRDDQLKASITSLVNKSLIEVIKMAGMRGVFMGADKENELQLQKRLEMVNWGRTFNSLTFLDKDDDYQEHGFSGLGGLSDLLDKNMILISAAVDMPGILFGDMSQGFAVDKDALKRYAEVIHDQCEDHFRTAVEKFLKMLFVKNGIDKEADFEFKRLDDKEQQDETIDRLDKYTGLMSRLLQDGILDVGLYAKSLQKYVKEGVVDFGLDDEAIKKLETNMENELENIDLEN